nr:unnamed protein product [Spirometra erinaceieuropaei]
MGPAPPPRKRIGSLSQPKPKWRPASHKCLVYSMLTVNRFHHARAANAHSARESLSWDTFGPNVPTTRFPLLPLKLLRRTPRRPPPLSPPSNVVVLPSSTTDTIRPAPTRASTTATSSTKAWSSRAPPNHGGSVQPPDLLPSPSTHPSPAM